MSTQLVNYLPPTKTALTHQVLVLFFCLIPSGSALATTQLNPVNVSSKLLPTGLMDSDVHPTEHTVNVLNQSMIEAFKPNKMEELVVYLPNIQAARLGPGIADDFIVRGFSTGGRLLIDGILDNQSYYIRDPATLQSMQIVKGHDSVLYGTGAPGGTVNYITKKPQYEQKNSLMIELGSFDRQRMVLDSTGPIASQHKLAYRSIAVIQKIDSWKKNVNDDRITLLNSLQWNYQPQSHLLASWEFSSQNATYDFDNVYAKGAPVYDVSYVHPSTRANRVFNRVTLDWRHAFAHKNALELKANLIKGGRDERQIGFFYMADENQPLVGYYREVDETFEQTNLKLSYQQAFAFKGVENDFTVGLEQNTTEANYQNNRATNTFGLDIYQPTFNFSLPTQADLSERIGHIQWQDRSIFVQNIAHLTPSLEFRAGFRQSYFELDNERYNVFKVGTDQSLLSKSFGLRTIILRYTPVTVSRTYPTQGKTKITNILTPN